MAFTDRAGGFRPGSRELPPSTLEAFGLGTALAAMEQVHGCAVDRVGDAGQTPGVDGAVSTAAGLVLVVRAADCVPLLLADPDAGVVAVAHAGRRGMAEGVVTRTVLRMREVGADSVVAWLGPHICGRCYEVPELMRAEVASIVPASWSETSWGTPALDLAAGVGAQLDDLGVEVVPAGGCTREHDALPSHRRDGEAAGRLAGLIGRRA